MKYEEFRKRCKTGDMILMSGNYAGSKLIKFMTKCEWSHCGIIIKVPEYDMVLLWEATIKSKTKSVETGEFVDGVALVGMSDKLRNYNGHIGFKFLSKELDDKQKKQLGELRTELSGKAFEEDKLEIVNAAYDGPFGRNTEDLSSIFCSELVAEAYQRVGIFTDNRKLEG